MNPRNFFVELKRRDVYKVGRLRGRRLAAHPAGLSVF